MDVYFRTKKMQGLCSSSKKMTRKLGSRLATKLQQRLAELQAAESLADISRLPPARCHELKQDREGQLSVDLVHPYRLVFEPGDDPVPCKVDGGLDWHRVTSVVVVEVADTHP